MQYYEINYGFRPPYKARHGCITDYVGTVGRVIYSLWPGVEPAQLD